MIFIANIGPYGLRTPLVAAGRASSIFGRRWFSNQFQPVGPAPDHPLKIGDPGFQRFSANIEHFRQHGRTTYLSQRQKEAIDKEVKEMSSTDAKRLVGLLENILSKEEAMSLRIQRIDDKVDELLNTSLKRQHV